MDTEKPDSGAVDSDQPDEPPEVEEVDLDERQRYLAYLIRQDEIRFIMQILMCPHQWTTSPGSSERTCSICGKVEPVEKK